MKTILLLLLIPILISGQTVTEKIKAKFKQINDAKIERLKECEEYRRIDSLNKLLDRYPLTDNLMKEEANKNTLIFNEDTNEIYSLSDTNKWLGITSNAKIPEENPTPKELQLREYFDKYDLVGTPITKNATGETKDVYLLTLSSIIKLWDEYAKWVEEQPVTEDKWIVKKNGDIVNEGGWTKPSLDGFIEFLRNKLKEN